MRSFLHKDEDGDTVHMEDHGKNVWFETRNDCCLLDKTAAIAMKAWLEKWLLQLATTVAILLLLSGCANKKHAEKPREYPGMTHGEAMMFSNIIKGINKRCYSLERQVQFLNYKQNQMIKALKEKDASEEWK